MDDFLLENSLHVEMMRRREASSDEDENPRPSQQPRITDFFTPVLPVSQRLITDYFMDLNNVTGVQILNDLRRMGGGVDILNTTFQFMDILELVFIAGTAHKMNDMAVFIVVMRNIRGKVGERRKDIIQFCIERATAGSAVWWVFAYLYLLLPPKSSDVGLRDLWFQRLANIRTIFGEETFRWIGLPTAVTEVLNPPQLAPRRMIGAFVVMSIDVETYRVPQERRWLKQLNISDYDDHYYCHAKVFFPVGDSNRWKHVLDALATALQRYAVHKEHYYPPPDGGWSSRPKTIMGKFSTGLFSKKFAFGFKGFNCGFSLDFDTSEKETLEEYELEGIVNALRNPPPEGFERVFDDPNWPLAPSMKNGGQNLVLADFFFQDGGVWEDSDDIDGAHITWSLLFMHFEHLSNHLSRMFSQNVRLPIPESINDDWVNVRDWMVDTNEEDKQWNEDRLVERMFTPERNIIREFYSLPKGDAAVERAYFESVRDFFTGDMELLQRDANTMSPFQLMFAYFLAVKLEEDDATEAIREVYVNRKIDRWKVLASQFALKERKFWLFSLVMLTHINCYLPTMRMDYRKLQIALDIYIAFGEGFVRDLTNWPLAYRELLAAHNIPVSLHGVQTSPPFKTMNIVLRHRLFEGEKVDNMDDRDDLDNPFTFSKSFLILLPNGENSRWAQANADLLEFFEGKLREGHGENPTWSLSGGSFGRNFNYTERDGNRISVRVKFSIKDAHQHHLNSYEIYRLWEIVRSADYTFDLASLLREDLWFIPPEFRGKKAEIMGLRGDKKKYLEMFPLRRHERIREYYQEIFQQRIPKFYRGNEDNAQHLYVEE